MAKETKKIQPIEFSFDDISESHDGILDDSPEANPEAIAAHAEEEKTKLREQANNIDKDGTFFDAKIHAVDKDGNASLTVLGKFRKKRGFSKVATQTPGAKIIQDQVAARAAGQLAADMVIGGAVALLGPEWIPIGEDGKQETLKFDEHSNLRRAFGDYFVAKNITDFPPGIALTIAMSSYAGARLAAGKETKSRLSKAWSWTSEKFNKLFSKAKENAAHADTRDNGIRKDDSRKEAVRKEPEERPQHAST